MQLVRESPDVPGAVHISHDALQDHVPGVSNVFFCRDRGSTERRDLATPLGFEPRITPPKGAVLPVERDFFDE
jgi:hypothetical protein